MKTINIYKQQDRVEWVEYLKQLKADRTGAMV
jgi:hypothetical protein